MSAGRVRMPVPPALRAIGVAVAAALLGALPWLATGLRLPLQNLWATDTAPGDMPRVLLPFSQYEVALLASVIVVAWGAAGLAARRLLRGGARAVLVAAAALAALHTVAIVQTAITVARGLQRDQSGWRGMLGDEGARPLSAASSLYLTSLTAVAVFAVLLGAAIYFPAARARVPLATAALGVAAVAFGTWLAETARALGYPDSVRAVVWFDPIAWLPSIAVGVLIVWCGVGSVGRVVADVLCLAVLWVGRAAVGAASAAVGSRVLLHQPREALEYARQLFLMMLGPASLAPQFVAVAVAVAVIGLVVVAAVRRVRRPR